MPEPDPPIDLTVELEKIAELQALLTRREPQVTDEVCRTAICNCIHQLVVIGLTLTDPLMRPKGPNPRQGE